MTENLTLMHSGRNFMQEVAETVSVQEKNGWTPFVIQIFSHLDNKTLKSLKLTCKNFKKLVSSHAIRLVRFKNRETELDNLNMKCIEKQQEIINREKMTHQLAANRTDVSKMLTEILAEYASLYEKISEVKMTEGLFGEQYADLPILDRKGFRVGNDKIQSGWMSAPIMKGRDADGRSFIAIRVKFKRTEAIHVDTFYQISDRESEWKARSIVVSTSKYKPFMSRGEAGDEKAFETLKDFIKKAENESYILA